MNADRSSPSPSGAYRSIGQATRRLLGTDVASALLRYRIMAYVVGVGLLILVLIGMPLQYGADAPGVVSVVGPIHGILYIVYLAAAYDLARRDRWTIWQIAGAVFAGFLPFLAFVVERIVTRRVETRLLADGRVAAP